MYEDFFGLRELPFNNTPDPRFFFSTRDHEEALASLIYAVQERKGFVLLTGEVGAGKTLVSRLMLRHFGTRIAFATINHSLGTGGDLLESICTEFELPVAAGTSRTQLVRLLHDFLLAKFAQDRPVVLVLDEAQTLPVDAFEQVRMIGNLEADDAKLLQVVMLGQPELQHKFATPALRQLRQRIFRSFHLAALGRDDCDGYIRHRLTVAGLSSPDIFESPAIDAVYEHSGGLPRIINTLCDNALLSAYSADRRKIDNEFVRSVIDQMMPVGATDDRFASGNASCASGYDQHSQQYATDLPRECAADFSGHPYPPESYRANEHGLNVPRIPSPTASGSGYEQSRGSEQDTLQWQLWERSVRDELALIVRGVESRLERLTRHVSGIETRVVQLARVETETRFLHQSVEKLVNDARSRSASDSSRVEGIDQREARLHRLATKTKTVIEEVRRIFGLLNNAAAKNQSAERQAWQTFERLVAQTERSSQLADRLDHLAIRGSSDGREVVSNSAELMKQASLPISPGISGTSPETGVAGNLERFQGLLSTTRQSLSDLRTLARRGEGQSGESTSTCIMGASSQDSAHDEPPTKRLAKTVDDLVEMVESGSAAFSPTPD